MSPQLLPEAPELPLRSSTRLDTGPGPERPVVGCGNKEMLPQVLPPDLSNKEAWRGEGAGTAFSKQRNWVT